MAVAFTPLTIRDITFRNRIAVSPMCQYWSEDGFANDWHLVHLGSRAVGGAGLVLTEASAVEPRGRISPQDLGIWKDDHVEFLSRIATFVKQQGAAVGVQLAHAGRKASVHRPWEGGAPAGPADGGWEPVAPSAIPFRPQDPPPHQLSLDEIAGVAAAFRAAAQRVLDAGFQVIEIHGAHGYLIHEFLSPLSNQRTDRYGGSFDNRTRLALEVCDAVRSVWPERLPLFLRISCTDWIEGGWNIDESVALAAKAKEHGVDLIDCSSGGLAPQQQIPVAPGYQVPFASRIRRETGLLTGAVGMITTPEQVESILSGGDADLVLLAASFCATRTSRCTPREPWGAARTAHPVRKSVLAKYLQTTVGQASARVGFSPPSEEQTALEEGGLKSAAG